MQKPTQLSSQDHQLKVRDSGRHSTYNSPIIHMLHTHTHCSVTEKSAAVKCHFIADAKLN